MGVTTKKTGLGVTHRTWDSVITTLRANLASRIPTQVVTLTPEMVVRMETDAEFRNIVDSASVVVADGVGVQWGEGKLSGQKPQKIPGIELAEWCLSEVDRFAGTVYLLGTKPETVRAAAENLSKRYPRLKICGFRDGFFGSDQESRVFSEISSLEPDLLLVGMGSPLQERLISKYLTKLSCVAIGVGGSLDVFGDAVVRAPEFFRKTNTEWLYRTLSQPSVRLKRIPELIKFIRLINSYKS